MKRMTSNFIKIVTNLYSYVAVLCVLFAAMAYWQYIEIQAAVSVIGLLIPGCFAYHHLKIQIAASNKVVLRKFRLEKKYQDAKANLPILLELLEDLYTLYQAFVFKGKFCPQLEHRTPSFSFADKGSDEKSKAKMSVAQRAFQFYSIGRKIINNCRKVIFLSGRDHLPKTVALCKQIKLYLLKQEPGKKRHLDFMIQTLVSSLDDEQNLVADKGLFRTYQEEFLQFHNELDAIVEAELPQIPE